MDWARRLNSMANYRYRKLGICVSMVIFGTFIGCTLLAYTAFASPTANHDTLQQVVFLFRHGDRNPTETYPTDPYTNYSWPGGWGALTKKGMLQLYNVGRWIRTEYGTFIGDKYESATTLVLSSYAERCIMSAQALLAGLFQPKLEDTFVPDLAWVPVPVHSIPRNLDKLITVKSPCPRLQEALKQAYIEEERMSRARMTDYYKELAELTGKNMSLSEVEFLYTTLEIESKHGLELPAWTRQFYNNEMREIMTRSLQIFTQSTIQKRLQGGPLLKEMLSHMEETRTGPQPKRSYFYSAHDVTIVNVLRTMGFTNELFKPDYGATIILELHLANNGADQEVKALYLNNTQIRITHPLVIPNCTNPCLLQNLKQVWHEVIPDDWNVECKL